MAQDFKGISFGQLKNDVFASAFHTHDDFGLIMSEQKPKMPSVQTSLIDVPGRDGPLDLSEATGGIHYGSREYSWAFSTDASYPERRGTLLTLYNYLHGRFREFKLDTDPAYTMRGRFYCDDIVEHPNFTTMKVTAACEPYRIAAQVNLFANAARGYIYLLLCGRKSVCPTFETKWTTNIEFEGVTYVLPPGTNKIRDLWFSEGVNEIYINSMPEGGAFTWAALNLQGITWGQFSTNRLIDWRWGAALPTETRNVYIQYDRKDL